MSKLKLSLPIIEVRGSTDLAKPSEYIVKGKFNGKIPDHYGTLKTPYGKKPLRSIFTDNCIESIRRQAKSKKIYVDAEHKTAAMLNVKKYLDDLKISEQDKEKILNQFQLTDLPLAKLNDIYRDAEDENILIFDTRLNPSFREANEKNKAFFDAVWNSIQNKFIDAISPDMVITDIKREGNLDVINDVVILGINYTGGGASPENSIFEVAMRATQEFNQERVNQMEAEEIERKKKELEEREKSLKSREEELKKAEETERFKKIELEKKEQKEQMEKMQRELEELKRARESGSRAVISDEGRQPAPLDEMQENAKYQKEIKDMLKERVQTKRAYPNRENLFGEAPRATNPDGDLTLGHLLVLDKDYKDAVIKNLPPDSRAALGKDADIIIPSRKFR